MKKITRIKTTTEGGGGGGGGGVLILALNAYLRLVFIWTGCTYFYRLSHCSRAVVYNVQSVHPRNKNEYRNSDKNNYFVHNTAKLDIVNSFLKILPYLCKYIAVIALDCSLIKS
jgi:hypothetical protein